MRISKQDWDSPYKADVHDPPHLMYTTHRISWGNMYTTHRIL